MLDAKGRKEFIEYCSKCGLTGAMLRVMKIKDFLNSAAGKFEVVDHVRHMNLLYINWTFSEFDDNGYQEAFSLMAHTINGILVHKDIGRHIGINEEVYDKITAVIVYTESLQGLMFGYFSYIWHRGYDGQPHSGIIGMHNCDGLFEVTRMNPYAEQLTPVVICNVNKKICISELIALIDKHMLRNVIEDCSRGCMET